ncbi:hypothetical protein WU85_04165 [Corynebacterium striatum]|nr:hypothetical protein WU85_04165 [Corynebacterium striatum]
MDRFLDESVLADFTALRMTAFGKTVIDIANDPAFDTWTFSQKVLYALDKEGPDPRKVDTSGVSYTAWVSVADVSASKVSGARRLHQECRLRVL